MAFGKRQARPKVTKNFGCDPRRSSILLFFYPLDFVKSNSGAGCEGFSPKVGSIPASDTIPWFHVNFTQFAHER